MATRKADIAPDGDETCITVSSFLIQHGWYVGDKPEFRDGRKYKRYFASRGAHQEIPVGDAWGITIEEMSRPKSKPESVQWEDEEIREGDEDVF